MQSRPVGGQDSQHLVALHQSSPVGDRILAWMLDARTAILHLAFSSKQLGSAMKTQGVHPCTVVSSSPRDGAA
jgi:hypothetical protein